MDFQNKPQQDIPNDSLRFSTRDKLIGKMENSLHTP